MHRFAIVVFPGSNCDHDCYYVLKTIFNQHCEFLWHESTRIDNFDCLIIPGGFSYGDYLRTGAIARFSPIMREVEKFGASGRPIIGICNGFQILVESGLLPGSFIRNSSTKFSCKWVNVRVGNTLSPFTCLLKKGDILRIPIAHGEGNYFANPDQIRRLNSDSLIAFKYCDEKGKFTALSNPNGSMDNIAGIINSKGNILGMMPHPERSCEPVIGGNDGKLIFESVIHWLRSHNH